MTSPAARRPRATTAALLALVGVAFADSFGLLPVVSPLAGDLGAGPVGVGVAVGAYSAANPAGNLLAGHLLDRIGRARVLRGALVVVAVTLLAYLPVAGLAELVGARLAHGLAGGLLVTAVLTVVADAAPDTARGRAMGRAGAVIGLAAVLAPAAGGLIREAAGWRTVLVVLAALMLAALVLTVAVTDPLGRPDGDRDRPGGGRGRPDRERGRRGGGRGPTGDPAHRQGRPSTAPVLDLLTSRRLTPAWVGTVALTVAVGVLAAHLPPAAEAAGVRPGLLGVLFSVFALTAAAVMLSGRAAMADRGRAVLAITVGLGALAVALAALGAGRALAEAAYLPVAVGGCALFGAGYGLVFPAAAGSVAHAAGVGARGRAVGVFTALFSLGFAAGPPAAGLADALAGLEPLIAGSLGVAAALAVVVVTGGARQAGARDSGA